MTDKLAIASRAKTILEMDEWKRAWEAYRENIFAAIEQAASNDTDLVMHLKRLLTSALAARQHLEMMISEGKIEELSLMGDKAARH